MLTLLNTIHLKMQISEKPSVIIHLKDWTPFWLKEEFYHNVQENSENCDKDLK